MENATVEQALLGGPKAGPSRLFANEWDRAASAYRDAAENRRPALVGDNQPVAGIVFFEGAEMTVATIPIARLNIIGKPA